MRTTFRTGASMRSQGEPSAKGARWRFPRGTWGWQPWHRYWESTQTMYEQWTLNIHIWLLEVWPQFHYPQLCFPVINTRGCKQRSTEPEPLSQLANLPIVAEVNYCSRNSFSSIYFQVAVLWWKTSKLVPLQLLLHKKQVTAKLGKISFFPIWPMMCHPKKHPPKQTPQANCSGGDRPFRLPTMGRPGEDNKANSWGLKHCRI